MSKHEHKNKHKQQWSNRRHRHAVEHLWSKSWRSKNLQSTLCKYTRKILVLHETRADYHPSQLVQRWHNHNFHETSTWHISLLPQNMWYPRDRIFQEKKITKYPNLYGDKRCALLLHSMQTSYIIASFINSREWILKSGCPMFSRFLWLPLEPLSIEIKCAIWSA